MKMEKWESLSTQNKLVGLMDGHNMSRKEAEAKLRKWGDWEEGDFIVCDNNDEGVNA